LTSPLKLPKEIMHLFPAWEYCCPSCGAYVESPVSFCPICKTAFNKESWRVPPRFLKSHEAMSEYVHTVLAPKLNPKQRESLFQYFTELFNDGFESGDFSAWDGTEGSPSVQGSVVHHGSYAMQVSDNGEHNCYKAFTASSGPVYARCYIQFSDLSSDGNYARFLSLENSSGYGAVVIIRNTSGVCKFEFYNKYYGDYVQCTTEVQVDTWYCVELLFWKYGESGNCKVWINGNLEAEETGNDPNVDVDRIYVGAVASDGNHYNFDYYIDCVVAADTYIGPETAAQTHTKTWTNDALFKKLGITKTLNVDAAFQKQNLPKTFGLDSTFQKSFTLQKQADALFKKINTQETFGVDTDFLRKNVIKSFAVDAHFVGLVTQTISKQIDSLLKKLDTTKNFGLDAYFGSAEAGAYTKNFALDVMFAYKVKLPELWLDENGKLVLNISKPYTWVGT